MHVLPCMDVRTHLHKSHMHKAFSLPSRWWLRRRRQTTRTRSCMTPSGHSFPWALVRGDTEACVRAWRGGSMPVCAIVHCTKCVPVPLCVLVATRPLHCWRAGPSCTSTHLFANAGVFARRRARAEGSAPRLGARAAQAARPVFRPAPPPAPHRGSSSSSGRGQRIFRPS